MTFEIKCGPEQLNPHPLRHKKDYAMEIQIDFEDGQEYSLGWLAVMHDMRSGKAVTWCLLDEHGDNLPGLRLAYPSKGAALKKARQFLTNRIQSNKPVRMHTRWRD